MHCGDRSCDIIFVSVVRDEIQYLGHLLDTIEALPRDIEWQLFIIDDHSYDGTCDFLKARSNKNARITVSSASTNGKVSAIAYALELVFQSEFNADAYVRFVDGDDYFQTELLTQELRMLANDKCDPELIYQVDLEMVDHLGNSIKILTPPPPRQFQKFALVPAKASWYLPLRVVSRFNKLQQYHGYEDFWIVSQLANIPDANVKYWSSAAYKYRQHENQIYAPTVYSSEKKEFRAFRLLYSMIGVILNESMTTKNKNILRKNIYGYILGVAIKSLFKLKYFNVLTFLRGLLRS